MQRKVKNVRGHVILEASQRVWTVSDFIFFCVQNGTAQVTRQRTTIRLQSSCFGNHLWPYKTWPFSWRFGLFHNREPSTDEKRTGGPFWITTQFEGVNPAPNRRWERWPSRAAHWPSETHSWLFTGPVSKHKHNTIYWASREARSKPRRYPLRGMHTFISHCDGQPGTKPGQIMERT